MPLLMAADVSRLVALSASQPNKAEWLNDRDIDLGFMEELQRLALPPFVEHAQREGIPLALVGAIGWAFGIGWLAKEASCSSDSPPS